MELLIPGWMVLVAAAIGGGVGVAVVLFSFLKYGYIDTDSARHKYMANQLIGLRHKYNDWEHEDDEFPGNPHLLERTMTWLLDVVYRRGRG